MIPLLYGFAPLFIPSPTQGTWEVFGFPLRAYALFIIVGIIVAWWLTQRRWQARGGEPDALDGVLVWAVIAGIIGARVYHVITDHQLYFGPGRDPVRALYIWEGGLGIWGAVAGGGLAVWWVCRRQGLDFTAMADCVAPGLVIAQAIGRLGNYFNQELFGRPTDLPWGLLIDPAHRPRGFEEFATFHPTFLYELVWNLLVAAVLLWSERRFRLGHGRVFALYVALYTFGRFWVEGVRIDTANHVFGLRINEWVSLAVCLAGIVAFWLLGRRHPGRDVVADKVDHEEVEEHAELPVIPPTSPDTADTAAATGGRFEGEHYRPRARYW